MQATLPQKSPPVPATPPQTSPPVPTNSMNPYVNPKLKAYHKELMKMLPPSKLAAEIGWLVGLKHDKTCKEFKSNKAYEYQVKKLMFASTS